MKTLSYWFGLCVAVLALNAACSARGQFAYDEYDRVGGGYVKFDVGGVIMPDFNFTSGTEPRATADPGFRFSFAGGWEIVPAFALELETGVLWNSIDKLDGHRLSDSHETIDISQIPLLVNAVYTFPARGPFNAYVGVGVGGVFTTIDLGSDYYYYYYNDHTTDTDAAFGYQAMAGLKYSIHPHMDVGVAYKFLGTTSHSWSDHYDHISADAIMSHSILATFAFRF
jgi:opacity protein-like surface antigen